MNLECVFEPRDSDDQKTFRFAIPVTGFQIFEVGADNLKQAKELILSGEEDSSLEPSVDIDVDTNNWTEK